MRATVLFSALAALVAGNFAWSQPDPKDGKKEELKAAKEANKDTPAAAQTRTKLLKVKVTGNFSDVRLGDVLKEFAAQVDMRTEMILMWTYGPGFPFDRKVTYSCKDKPLEDALDELLDRIGEPGYVVVSKEGDKYDGWVRLTNAGERGYEKGQKPKASPEDEAAANERLTIAKKFIADGKPDLAKPLLMIIPVKYPNATAVREAKKLLAQIQKK